MRKKRKIINLFEDKNIYSIKYVVSVSEEEDLNQFWDFLSNSENSSHQIIHTFITQFYNFALSYMSKDDSEFFELILEENEKCFYFTLWNKKIALLFKSYVEGTSSQFIYYEDRISVKLVKKKCQDKKQKIDSQNKKREKNLIKSVTNNKKIKKIEAYTFLDTNDLEELLTLSDDLLELTYHANKNGFNEDNFISFRSKFSLFCLTLRYYDQVSPITLTMTQFSNLLNTHQQKFINLEPYELELISGFIANIDKWLQTLFVTGGANLYFMDNSIKADYNTIVQITTMEDIAIEEYDLDDIFDF